MEREAGNIDVLLLAISGGLGAQRLRLRLGRMPLRRLAMRV